MGRNLQGVFWGGIVAGIIAGSVTAMVAMMYARSMGMGLLMPLRLIGATVYGVDALIGRIGVLMMGMILHLIASAAFGVIFAALSRTPKSATVRAIMTFAILPWLNPTMYARVQMMMSGSWAIEHLVFGGAPVITPALSRRFSRRAELREWPTHKAA